ncbi:uncharacterized protein LOC121887811 isoform X5 [Thunnus maccoyii]|uniref:uncharacterized protein LOC121887811 isoform X5 n=1 Tax=Thunnus maccoyii TaxID=8240 RepID=UPI001C4D58D6|nr:uncharacterized protein LOC121887811 isoform X5 [Thunnus maccoyii]
MCCTLTRPVTPRLLSWTSRRRISQSQSELQESQLDLWRNTVACSNTKSSFRDRPSGPGAPESERRVATLPWTSVVIAECGSNTCHGATNSSKHCRVTVLNPIHFQCSPSMLTAVTGLTRLNTRSPLGPMTWSDSGSAVPSAKNSSVAVMEKNTLSAQCSTRQNGCRKHPGGAQM